MITYNKKDAEVVYRIADKFFKFTFTTAFGHGILPKMFYHSVSSLAWDMWSHCFNKVPLFINRHTITVENSMNLGGFT